MIKFCISFLFLTDLDLYLTDYIELQVQTTE